MLDRREFMSSVFELRKRRWIRCWDVEVGGKEEHLQEDSHVVE